MCNVTLSYNENNALARRKLAALLATGLFTKLDEPVEVADDTAKSLEALASEKDWRIVQPDEAKECGFEELVEWSVPETDILVMIDDNYLVCLPKQSFS